MMFGQKIPKGYLTAFHSSENGGDFSHTVTKTGLSKIEADVILALFPLFKSNNSRGRNRTTYGNVIDDDDIDVYSFLEAVQKRLQHLDKNDVDKVLGCAIMNVDLESEDLDNELDLFESISDYVKDMMLGYSQDYFFRYSDKIDVYYLPGDVIIPNVEKVNSLS